MLLLCIATLPVRTGMQTRDCRKEKISWLSQLIKEELLLSGVGTYISKKLYAKSLTPISTIRLKMIQLLIKKDIITATVAELISQKSLQNSATNLIQDNPRCSMFYLLPKIHKVDNTGRPIVSTINCPTELISQYFDCIFFPIVTMLLTLIKDTSDVIRLCKDIKFTDDYQCRYLFTMDICSLYTNIPTAVGLTAHKYYLEYYPDESRLFTPTLLKLAELVLNLSSFEFDGKYYIQKKGVAMGTNMGPSYACLFVGYFEEKMLLTYTGTKPIMLWRYIDDYFGISTSTKNELEDFMQYVNDFHPSLSYTYDISDISVNFLDISISMTQHGLTTDIFYKDTDTHSYLRYESAHPPSWKKVFLIHSLYDCAEFVTMTRLLRDVQMKWVNFSHRDDFLSIPLRTVFERLLRSRSLKLLTREKIWTTREFL